MINESGVQIKITTREKVWAGISHVSSFIGLILFIIVLAYIAFDIIIQYNKYSNYDFKSLILMLIPIVINSTVPLIFWSSTRQISPFVNEHSKQSLNFQLSVTLYFIISIASVFIAVGVIMIFVLILYDISCVIDAFKKAIDGENYRYSIAIHFFR